jgi:hypothetical protein
MRSGALATHFACVRASGPTAGGRVPGGRGAATGLRELVLLATAALAFAGCELEEVTVVDLVDVAVAETYVVIREDPAQNRVRAFLHGTTAGGAPNLRTFEDARVRVTRSDGLVLDFGIVPVRECVDSLPPGATGTCFAADTALVRLISPGDALELRITFAGGEAMSAVRVPGAFRFTGSGAQCRLVPDTSFDLVWSRSAGAWAYVSETLIEGLAAALEPEGIAADDPLYLLGLSVSAQDTTIAFPSEFGLFDRFDLDRALAVRLQRGLPDATYSRISVAAVERNYVNWVRGGSFNPSGAVRVSSLRGDATGVFAAAVVRDLVVITSASPLAGVADCPR